MDIEAYLQRIDYRDSLTVDIQTLRSLHLAHLLAVPFENLDVHLGRPINIDEASWFNKIVKQHRGGFCYELNGLFSWLLRELGFDVTYLSARVVRADGNIGREFGHLTLLVNLDQPYLADVGFGDSFREPLPLAAAPDVDNQTYRLICHDAQWMLQQRKDEATWQERYLFTLAPRQLTDFAQTCHYNQTSLESIFTQQGICTIATPKGRITLSDMRLIITEQEKRQERLLESQEEYKFMLQNQFGINL